MRPLQMRVQHRAHASPLLHRLDGPGQQFVEFGPRACLPGPEVPARGGLGDAGVVGGGGEGEVEGFVRRGGAVAGRVDEEEGSFGRVPACGLWEGNWLVEE